MADKKEEELARINAEMERLLSMPAPFPEKVRPAEMTAELEHLVRAGSKSRDDDRLGKVIFFLIVAGMFGFVIWAGGIREAWYCAKYQVTPDKIHVDAKPKDCDFLHAPLGIKGCHYEADVNAYNAEGMLVGGDHAPKYGRDSKTRKPVVSWDDGKTWEWMASADAPNTNIVSIGVSWVRVTD
jgi:hypothetical protein